MTDTRSPEQWTRGDYAALPQRLASKLRRGWRNVPGTQANAPNGAPFPLRSWPPDAAVDIQLLAEFVDPWTADRRARAYLPAPVNNISADWYKPVLTTDYAVGGMTHANGVITVPVEGVYAFAFRAMWDPTAATVMAAWGTDVEFMTVMGTQAPASAHYVGISFPNIAVLSAGQKIALWVQCSAANQPLTGADIVAAYLGPKKF